MDPINEFRPDKNPAEAEDLQSASFPVKSSLSDLLAQIKDWFYEEEVGEKLEFFNQALALAKREGKEAELNVYQTFAEKAVEVDWEVVVVAEQLLLKKLYELALQGTNLADASSYFSILKDLVFADSSVLDTVERFKKFTGNLREGPLQAAYSAALEGMLAAYLAYYERA